MTPDQERRHLYELAKVARTRMDIATRIFRAEMALMLRDLATSGEADTFLGRVAFRNGVLVLLAANAQFERFTDPKALTDLLYDEFPTDV